LLEKAGKPATSMTLDPFPTSKICPAGHSADGQIYEKGFSFLAYTSIKEQRLSISQKPPFWA
jgi:hypothetical protein